MSLAKTTEMAYTAYNGRNMLDKILCFSLHFLLGLVCQTSHELREQGKAVKKYYKAMPLPKGCVFIRELQYQCGHSFSVCIDKSYENYVRNQALYLGANSILISRVLRTHNGIGVYIEAKVYKCKQLKKL